jgi:pimeloyl-ACP methyl ester carboxylesterase
VTRAGLTLVHGMWHGPAAWAEVRRLLDRADVPSTAAELPLTSLTEDAGTVRRLLDVSGPTVLVGHSYGGAVITAAGAHPAVRHLVYLAAFALDDGESVSRVLPELAVPPTGLGGVLRFSADGAEVTVDEALAPEVLYGHCSAEQAAAAIRHHRPVHRGLFGARMGAPAWRTVPSTYVVCSDDRAVAPELQRAMAARATHSLEIGADHCPQLSHPQLVADLLISMVRDVSAR